MKVVGEGKFLPIFAKMQAKFAIELQLCTVQNKSYAAC